jgi:pimeloyl-ACP methyl ester carboxylesterase
MSSTDVVFLVPGFLGFERTGNFSQFGDRVCSALRAHMEGRLGRQVGVIPLGSLPTTSFAGRQRALLEALGRHVLALRGVERIHLLGHSVGGIDAHLLACARPLAAAGWQELDPQALRSKLRTVVSLATPHHGTCLAAAPGAGALTVGSLFSDPGGAAAMLQLVGKLLGSAWRDVGAQERPQGMLREGRKVSHFMAELMRWQGFFHALTPDAMDALYARSEPLEGVARRSFVTMAGRALDVAGAHAPADDFFRELSRRTSGSGNGFTRHEPVVRSAMLRLRDALAAGSARVVVSEHAKAPPHVDAQTNDGVVNAARQLIDPTDERELCAVVVADHFDVLGYYDRRVGVAEPGAQEPAPDLVSGLLHSGSCFRDSEFFALYRRVGDAILTQCAEGRVGPLQAVYEAEPRPRQARRTPSRRPTA